MNSVGALRRSLFVFSALCLGAGALSNGPAGSRLHLVTPPPAPAPVLTWHNDVARTGAYSTETILTPTNVNTGTFGKLFTQSIDGPAEAQPLWVPAVQIPGKGTHNVVYVATMNDKVYAFDSDNNTGSNASPLWTTDVGPYVPANTGGNGDSYNHGVVSTPVIDPLTKTMYVFSKNMIAGTVGFRIHALDITSGEEKFGGPYNVAAYVPGTIGGVGGKVQLVPLEQYQRCGLLLFKGVVYVAIGGIVGDNPPDRGWILGFSASTLHHVCTFTTAPDAGIGSQTADAGGAIWMGGGGPSTDGTYIYVATGNGDFDANQPGGKDYSDSVLKLLPSGNTLSVIDYFTPYNQASLSDQDLDLGCSGPMVFTPPNATHPLLFQLSKDGEKYTIDSQNMGHYDPARNHVIQNDHGGGASRSTPAYYNGNMFFTSDGGSMVGYKVNSTGLHTVIGVTSARYVEASPSISYNGMAANQASTAIVWVVESSSTSILHAYAVSNMHELYNSNSIRDQAGPFIKFNFPTIANGKVYVPCVNELDVYGPLG